MCKCKCCGWFSRLFKGKDCCEKKSDCCSTEHAPEITPEVTPQVDENVEKTD